VPLRRRSWWADQLVALACVAAATLVAATIQTLIDQDIRYLTFYPAILVAAVLGGWRAGLTALVLASILGQWLFITPHGRLSMSQSDLIVTAAFLIAGGAIAAVGNGLTETLRLRARSEHRFRSLAQATSQIVFRLNAEGKALERNEEFRAFTGMAADDEGGMAWSKLVHPDDLRRLAFLTPEQAQRKQPVSVEFRLHHAPSGDFRWVRANAVPVVEADGRAREWVGAIEDIHDRRLAEEQTRTVARELEHRVKNIFGLMQALVRQSARSAESVGQYQETLEARLQALSQAQNLLTAATGDGVVDLRALVGAALEPFGIERNGGGARGPDVAVKSNLAVPLALMLHELGTNAAKYGALSGPEGRVDVDWEAEAGQVRLRWRERDGPPVLPPQSKGFGSRLIGTALGGHGGRAELRFEPGGVCCDMSFPAAAA
jgi:PAS domain S-box-containing protein